ncbi:hypothetical protein EVAR_6794_1 [Eumeta japonica]|uniref:Uncharacterized protein n=1 Tax=Eumeta variegata TaxID=151549 RepID=A0A4C1U629_EUMVA|nr:hypothetical protein EVAR_6794_1 [Eumeta japonica]
MMADNCVGEKRDRLRSHPYLCCLLGQKKVHIAHTSLRLSNVRQANQGFPYTISDILVARYCGERRGRSYLTNGCPLNALSFHVMYMPLVPVYCSALSLARSAQAEHDNESCFFAKSEDLAVPPPSQAQSYHPFLEATRVTFDPSLVPKHALRPQRRGKRRRPGDRVKGEPARRGVIPLIEEARRQIWRNDVRFFRESPSLADLYGRKIITVTATPDFGLTCAGLFDTVSPLINLGTNGDLRVLHTEMRSPD